MYSIPGNRIHMILIVCTDQKSAILDGMGHLAQKLQEVKVKILFKRSLRPSQLYKLMSLKWRLNYKPCNTPLKYRCPIMDIDRIRHTHLTLRNKKHLRIDNLMAAHLL
jgi:hypothetical protein